MATVPVEALRVGILFGVVSTPHLVGRVRVLLDGEDVTDRTREGCVGDDGWVEAFRLNEDGRQYLERGEIAREILKGRVVLEWKEGCAP